MVIDWLSHTYLACPQACPKLNFKDSRKIYYRSVKSQQKSQSVITTGDSDSDFVISADFVGVALVLAR